MTKAIPDSYWVLPGCFMAGEYPCSLDEAQARRKARWLLEMGVSFCLDLTQAGEAGLCLYAPLLYEEAAAMGRQVRHERMPVPDMTAPSVEEMKRILDALDAALAQGQVVYAHCYGGIGRTGTLVGCYLARHGMAQGEAAIARIAELRRGTPDGWKRSPETEAQRRLVTGWAIGA
ncbi:MAG: hypothetical protein AB1894_27480 [Chloroflexota bacterium]